MQLSMEDEDFGVEMSRVLASLSMWTRSKGFGLKSHQFRASGINSSNKSFNVIDWPVLGLEKYR